MQYNLLHFFGEQNIIIASKRTVKEQDTAQVTDIMHILTLTHKTNTFFFLWQKHWQLQRTKHYGQTNHSGL